jgi:hypothetical protein
MLGLVFSPFRLFLGFSHKDEVQKSQPNYPLVVMVLVPDGLANEFQVGF